ncbi:MAG: phosphoribosylaminoimidazolesuccinocarboxamide synthase [Verrucomicrobiota bacterium]
MQDTPELLHSGKVREVYSYGQDQLILVASDRISAFDVILPTLISGKGIALTQIAKFWFQHLPEHISHHVTAFELPDAIRKPEWLRRSTLCHRAKPLMMECIVRGYLAGSGWKDYQKTAMVQGHALPDGLVESAPLPEPIFTPSTKASEGHDLPLTEEAARQHVGDAIYEEAKKLSLEIYQWAHDFAKDRGIIIADTKFEFGFIDDKLVLIDEILTPDSSRFWPAEQYAPGDSQPSFDKQFIRDYLLTLKDWNGQSPGPELPQEIVQQTQAKYAEAYERLTGQKADWS